MNDQTPHRHFDYEADVDETLAPLLKQIWDFCKERDIPLVIGINYKRDDRSISNANVVHLPPDAPEVYRLAHAALLDQIRVLGGAPTPLRDLLRVFPEASTNPSKKTSH